jgi:hypothetical protein
MGAHLLVLPEVTNRMRGIYQHILLAPIQN